MLVKTELLNETRANEPPVKKDMATSVKPEQEVYL